MGQTPVTYQIGQRLTYEKPRGITGDPLDAPQWYALTVPPAREHAARMVLNQNGVHAQYPVREAKYTTRGKQITRKFPMISRVVYAQFRSAPNWDVLKYRRVITGVYGIGETPLEIPYDVVRSVMGMPTVAEELAAAQRQMRQAVEGAQAKLLDGPFSGHVVDVTRVSAGRVWFQTLTGIKGNVEATRVERI